MSDPHRGDPSSRPTPVRSAPPTGNGRSPDPLAPHRLTPAEALEEAELPHAPSDAAEAPIAPLRARLTPHVAIGLGGLFGANARYWVGQWATGRWGAGFPWSTLLINVSGAFVLGFYLALVTERFTGRATTRLFVATGFLGAYTTFSTFSDETLNLLRHGAIAHAVAYVAASLLLGLAGVILGMLGAHAL